MAAVSKYPAELKERAVAMARDLERELGPGRGAIARVAAQLGIHPEALRYWVRRDEAGHPPVGTTQPTPVSAESERIAELERENRELRRAKEILKLASLAYLLRMRLLVGITPTSWRYGAEGPRRTGRSPDGMPLARR